MKIHITVHFGVMLEVENIPDAHNFIMDCIDPEGKIKEEQFTSFGINCFDDEAFKGEEENA